MHMRFTLCSDDIIEMDRAKWKSVRKGIFLAFCLIGLLLLALTFIAVISDKQKAFRSVLTLLGIPLITFTGLFYLVNCQMKLRAKKQLGDNPSLQGPVEVELNEEGLSWTGTDHRGQSTWSAFVNFLESDNLFVIFYSPQLARILPKRGFASEADVSAMREILASQIGRVYPAKRS